VGDTEQSDDLTMLALQWKGMGMPRQEANIKKIQKTGKKDTTIAEKA